MLKFINLIKLMAVLTILFGMLISCSYDKEPSDIFGRWVMQQVVYDDGSINQLEDGNFIVINTDSIVEIIKNHGNRQYEYTKEGNIITLNTASNQQSTWQILNQTNNHLVVATPIGKYILSRQ